MYLPVVSVAIGAVLGFFPTFLNERQKERRRLATRWDETLHETCSGFAAACRRTVALARRVADGDESAETRDALHESHERVRELQEQLYLLADPDVQRASRLVLRRLYAVRVVSEGGTDERAAEYPESTPVDAFFSELREFYRAARVQLRVHDPRALAEIPDSKH